MAWRIAEHLVRGEIDNRVRGRVTGRLWFSGRDEPVLLELEGNAWRDVAGHLLRFTNPTPEPCDARFLEAFAGAQRGVVGDITASRKVKVPDCSIEELRALARAGKPFPWHWSNSLYLEWYGDVTGRVLIEAAHYVLEIDPANGWTMTEAEDAAQREANGRAMTTFMERLLGAASDEPEKSDYDTSSNFDAAADDEEDEDDETPSAAEARADAEHARMDLLLDRVQARIDRMREAGEKPDFERIMEEERERLRRERGEPEPEPLTPEEEAEREEWIAELNEIAEAALAEAAETAADEAWDDDEEDGRWHPLVERCARFREQLRHTLDERGWLTEQDPSEHPLRELINGVMIAGAKLAGALGSVADAKEWPPDALFAGDVLVRLKKARGYLRDALAGLTAADEQGLADAAWRNDTRREATEILAEVKRLITEVRAVLRDADDDGDA